MRIKAAILSIIALGIVVAGSATAGDNFQLEIPVTDSKPLFSIDVGSEGVYIDEDWFPKNQTIYYDVSDPITGEVVSTGSFMIEGAVFAAIADTGDPYVIRNVTDNQFMTEIYQNQGTQIIEYRESDIILDEVTLIRPATQGEVLQYNLNKLSLQTEQDIINAKQSLTGSPDGGGFPFEQWVTNRSADLQSCEDDMIAGQLLDFGNQGPVAQTTTIHRMQECIEINSRVQRQVINNLYDLLIAEGIIVPSSE